MASLPLNPTIAQWKATLPDLIAANPAAPALGTNIAMPSSVNLPASLGASMPSVTEAPTAPAPITPLQTLINKRDDAVNKGSGIDQIQNPLLRGIARAGDIAGSVFAPNLAQFIPGTTLHHQLVVNQFDNNIAKDQAENQAAAQTANEEATTAHTNAATNALQNPNDKFTPIQTDSGFAAFDPSKGTAKPILGADGTQLGTPDKTKAPTTPFELWLKQNPNGTVDDFNKEQAKPLSAQEAQSLNAVWNGLAAKHHLPIGQFTEGMPHADATQLASSLNTAIGKQQGDVHITIGQQAAAQKGALDTSDPAMQASVNGVANGSVKLTDVFGRGATTAQKAQFVAAVKQVNPNYNSGDHDIENKVRQYMTSGQGGATLTAGTTLNHHLDLYEKAVDAVQNGDNKTLNSIGNALNIQMGNDAQTNLALIRQGVAMEAARFWTGGVPGEAEINQFNQNLSGDGWPKQMHGGANTVRFMAKGKLQGLQGQAEAGATGQPNFAGAAGVSAPSDTPPSGAKVRDYTQLGKK